MWLSESEKSFLHHCFFAPYNHPPHMKRQAAEIIFGKEGAAKQALEGKFEDFAIRLNVAQELQ